MSTNTTDPAAASVAEFQSDLFSNHAVNIALTLVCYEYIFTLQHEYNYWRRKWTVATWLFIANRYLMLAVSIDQVMPYVPQTCTNYPLQIFLHTLALLPYAVAAAFSALRVYAMLERSYLVAGFVLILGLVPAAINAYLSSRAFFYYVDDPVLGPSCFADLSISNSANFYASLFSPLTVFIADVVVVIVTWIKTYRLVREASSLGIRRDATVSATLLRDGSIYFVALSIFNIAELLVSVVPAFTNANPLVVILQIMPSILISRFLINLRQINDRSSGGGYTGTMSSFSQPDFRMPSTVGSIIGPMGEPLEHGVELRWDDSENNEMPSSEGVTESIMPDVSSAEATDPQ